MSRSVSAPSSVTNTSPCWNGFIVPGSTLRYGSSFCMVTRSPRALSRRPRLEAVRPLPRLEATPPVTKRCLVDAGRDEYGTAAKGRLPWSVRSGESRRSTGHQDISQRIYPVAPHRDRAPRVVGRGSRRGVRAGVALRRLQDPALRCREPLLVRLPESR